MAVYGVFTLAIVCALVNFPVDGKEVVCEPNLRVIRGCNSCTCSPDGSLLACTFKGCAPNSPAPIVPPGAVSGNDVVCRAGNAFQAECNNCRCSTMGNDISCTRRLCLESEAL